MTLKLQYSILILLLVTHTILVFNGYFGSFDVGFLEAMRAEGRPVGPSWLPSVMLFITHSGASVTLIIMAAISLTIAFKKYHKVLFLNYSMSFLGVFLLTPLLKFAFGRARPDVIDHLSHAASASFPSGHALRSAVVYLLVYSILAHLYPALKRFKFIVVGYVLLIGFSRLYLGVHWPTDVLASWLIAALWLTFWNQRLSKSSSS